ncbi:MAG TPA: peroxiredoxin [Clostridia bacterium]|nr:peroxiredoxin [Clostridia bacterium]
MKLVEVGMKAPDFTMDDVNGEPVKLSDFLGKKVLLSWHPIAWTSVCTDQMRALDANWGKFEALNTVPLGISVDPSPSKKVWAAALALKHLPLLSDFWPHGKVAQDYGIFHEEFGMSERANILVDEKGYVRWVKVYPMGELPDLNEVFEALSK